MPKIRIVDGVFFILLVILVVGIGVILGINQVEGGEVLAIPAVGMAGAYGWQLKYRTKQNG